MIKLGGKEGRAGFLFFVMMMILLCAYFIMTRTDSSGAEISYTDFLEYVDMSKVTEVNIKDGTTINGLLQSSNGQYSRFRTQIPYDDVTLMERLRNAGVEVSGSKTEQGILSLFMSYIDRKSVV